VKKLSISMIVTGILYILMHCLAVTFGGPLFTLNGVIYSNHLQSGGVLFNLLLAAINVLMGVSLFPYWSASHVSHPSGWRLLRFAELCFSKKTFAQVLEPALSDMQKEHFEALAAGRPWQARMALVRGYWTFWSAVAAQLPISFARRVYEVWKATKTSS
jgi:hypothetical protein